MQSCTATGQRPTMRYADMWTQLLTVSLQHPLIHRTPGSCRDERMPMLPLETTAMLLRYTASILDLVTL